jgi:hypothetical protein
MRVPNSNQKPYLKFYQDNAEIDFIKPKHYKQLFSEEEVNDLFNIIVDNQDWYVSGTVGNDQTKIELKDEDGNYHVPDDYYNNPRSRISQGKGKHPDQIPNHFKKKILHMINDYAPDARGYYFNESWTVQRYLGEQGGKFDWHHDDISFFKMDPTLSPDKLFVQNAHPRRRLSISVAMNDHSDYNHGNLVVDETGTGMRDKATTMYLKKGDACIFQSSTLHAVEPVSEGTRFALIIWVVFKEDYKLWKEQVCLEEFIEQNI